jgi:Glycosyl hydrolase family 1
MGLRPLVTVVACVLALACAQQAAAAPGVKYGLTDDAWLLNGSGSLDARVARLQELGVRVVRFSVHWDQVAPTKPAAPTDPSDTAYDWSTTDPVLDALHGAGIDVVLQLVGAPRWANGGHASNYAPTSATSFRDFATATAQHYSWVKRWLVWNEPNQVRWLRPTSAAVYTTRLLNPAYAAIHAAIAGAQVAGGVTAPRGATGGVSPTAWLLGMRATHARLDAYAHNPYPLNPRTESPLSGGCTRCTTITMATIGKLVGLVSRSWPRARIWLTEYGYQSNPPDRVLGVPLARQAQYVGEGAYAAYRTSRVDLLIHFLYRDEPQLARFQSGLVTLTNAQKPAYAAFELPLAQVSRTQLWGQFRAPAAPRTGVLERRAGSRWVTLGTVRTGSGGFFRWTGALQRGWQVRLHTGTLTGAPITIR